jgi:hypothetical protein
VDAGVNCGSSPVAIVYFALSILEKIGNRPGRRTGAFEILYDPDDSRYVRQADNDATRYFVGLHILNSKSVLHPNVRVRESEFTTRVLAKEHLPAGVQYSSGPIPLYSGGALDPDDIELIPLVRLPSYRYLYIKGLDDPIGRPQRFVLEARGRDVRTVTREFEYDPTKMPMIRMLL